MLKKLKKFMIVAAAAVMLSAGFATVAPKEASAHWADSNMEWAFGAKIITTDQRDSLATRSDAWVMINRIILVNNMDSLWPSGIPYYPFQAQGFVLRNGISDGTRETNWVTRQEVAAMLYNVQHPFGASNFDKVNNWALSNNIYDLSRKNDFATRAEVVTMIRKGQYINNFEGNFKGR
ncbi:Uncharacterized protein BC05F1_03829 [Bacillus wiedmannii]|uniref:SLH domain-containing protein n=2 Tax=Bacillus wiedmannii TaxID=1890302 RepID=A0A1C4ERB1_9BACI|nr:Uncharacterized protein BC05F1_03829 [Bacillus wiedmannii]